MKCAVHPEADATGYCRNCGKAMCPQCTREVRGVLYCEPCLASMVTPLGVSAAPIAAEKTAPSPAIAFLLGFVPGLGAVYNGEYAKALAHAAIFLILFTAGVDAGDYSGGAQAALWILISAFWLYMAIDAHRTAKLRQAGQASADPFAAWSKDKPIGPMLLIALGFLLLLHKLETRIFHRIFEFWPVVLIALGLWLLRDRISPPAR